MLAEIQEHIQRLADEWSDLNQWVEPNLHECVDFIVEEAAEAHSARIRLTSPQFSRNHSFPIKIADLDEEVADCLIMCLRHFNIRGIQAGGPVLAKLGRMDAKKKAATGPMSPELRSLL